MTHPIPAERARASHRVRAVTTVVLLAVLAFTALVLGAAPAGAHAQLISTEPAAGEQLDAPPETVVLRFSEGVTAADDGIRVLTADAAPLDVGEPKHPDGDASAVAVDLPALEDGTYVVVWRVISADSHPVSGAFTFRVGNAPALSESETQSLVSEVLAGAGSDRAVGAAYGIVRLAAFAGLVVLVGGAAFVLVLWPEGVADRRARRLLVGAWALTVGATVLAVPLQAVYAAGGSLADVLDPAVVGDELGARTGRLWLLRLVLLAVVAVASRRARAWPRSWGLAAAAVLGTGLLATVTFAGHATSGDVVPLAVVADLVHLGAVSVWLGGLAMLTGVVLRGDADGDGIAEAGLAGGAMSRDELVGRFSPVAFGAVVAIVTSGVIQAWRQLGSWDALLDTNYGRLLLVKVSLVVAMLAAASVSRAWVRQRAAARAERLVLSPGPGATAASPDRRAPLSVLRRSVAVEAGLAVAVLAVTALLVNAVPGATASDSGSGGPFSATLPGENSAVQVVVDPAEVGPTQIHMYVTDPVGEPIVPEEVTASLSLPDRDIGRLDVPLVAITPDHYIADNAEFPFPGDWQLEILVRTSAFDQDRLVTELSVP